MYIKISMPEILIIFSLFMYSQSFNLAMTAFVLGIAGRLFGYLLEFQEKQAQSNLTKDSVEEVATVIKDIFSPNE